MKKWKIEYRPEYIPGPMSFWVHKHLDSEVWHDAPEFDPPLPTAIPVKGFPVLIVNIFQERLIFTSIEEAEHFLEIISQKNMPTSIQLSQLRGSMKGPNSHWLSRLPAKIMPWVKREKIIPVVKEGLVAYKKVYNK